MRWLVFVPLLAACTDASDVPTTVVHAHVSASCTNAACQVYAPEVYYQHCGPSTETVIDDDTRAIELTTHYDAADIVAYVQAQYTTDVQDASELAHIEGALTQGSDYVIDRAYPAWDDEYKPLYRVSAEGVIDIDTTKLVAASSNHLQFAYTSDQLSVVEDHIIDAPRTIHITTDDPGLSDACCTVGRAQDLGLVVLGLALVLRRRRRAR